MAEITLFCYVLGTPVYSAIPANNNKANELKLRKFVTPLDEDNQALKELNKKLYENIELSDELKSTGPSRGITQVFENKDEVLTKAESHWTKLKDKLIKKIELEEFRVSNHIYKDSINASGIPVINKRPSFILHSLPDSDNEGTSGSGKTRSLYELLCRAYGIYFSLNTENNLGSRTWIQLLPI
ncbi:unnamed protein product [Rhizophagus irregularis]|uniref:Uncharacterized protein n=1 Tax=Rhizophagus irregularis TaxID=588596 RepID=A0A916EA66_9GLOM|nr:unnamed protein product [Rhizophagus irregularis]CAB5366492.1 unnamed protein product [Rhizophagus irregularis]